MELRLTAVQPTSAQGCCFYASESLISFRKGWRHQDLRGGGGGEVGEG